MSQLNASAIMNSYFWDAAFLSVANYDFHVVGQADLYINLFIHFV